MLEVVRGSFVLEKERDFKPREECGIFGIFLPDISTSTVEDLTFEGLLTNQHRGEESAGITIADGSRISKPFTMMGLVRDVYNAYKHLPYRPEGHIALAHTRYSTTGSSRIENAAPFLAVSESLGEIAVAHNGNLTNAQELRTYLLSKGVVLKGATDSEVLAYFIAGSEGETWEDKICCALRKCQGSFSLAMISKDTLFAARDPMGIRPLFISGFEYGGKMGFAVSSETPAFTMFDRFHFIDEVKPGELVTLRSSGKESRRYSEEKNEAFCGLEIAYLLRADGRLRGGVEVDNIRRNLGRILARLHPPPADIDYVTYIPESAKSTAEGFAEGLSDLFERPVFSRTSMIKGRYGTLAGAVRGFINPDNHVRGAIANRNYFPFDWIKGAKIALIDDSIIRGNTTAGVIALLRKKVGFMKEGGAKEIHMRVPWPPVIGFCPLGTDINEKDFLIYRELGGNLEKVRVALGVDSLEFLTPEEFQNGVDSTIDEHLGLCMGCTTGDYPVTVFQANKNIFEKC